MIYSLKAHGYRYCTVRAFTPKDYHGLVNSVPEVQLNQMLTRLLEIKKEPIAKLPTHDEYINGMVAKYKRAMS